MYQVVPRSPAASLRPTLRFSLDKTSAVTWLTLSLITPRELAGIPLVGLTTVGFPGDQRPGSPVMVGSNSSPEGQRLPSPSIITPIVSITAPCNKPRRLILRRISAH